MAEKKEDKREQKQKRMWVSGLGEYYSDCLMVEAFCKDRTIAFEGGSLLGSKLQEREARRDKIVAYLAKKRRITPEKMWEDIVSGKAKPLSQEEFAKIVEIEEVEAE